MVTLGFTILFAVFVAISALFGLVRGLNKAVIRLITLVLAVILTFVIAGPITTQIAQSVKIDGLTLGEMIAEALGSTDMFYDIFEAVPLVREVVVEVPAFVISIVVFPVVFLVLKFITWIVFLCVQKPLRKLIFKDSCNKEEAAMAPKGVRVGKRLGGLGVGIVTGVVIFGMVLTPVFGVLSMFPAQKSVEKALDTMIYQELMSASDAEMIGSVYAVTDSALINFYELVGVASAGRAYLNSAAAIEADGQTIGLADELALLLGSVQTAADLGLLDALAADDMPALYAFLADKTRMEPLVQELFQSKILYVAVPEVMVVAMEFVANKMNVPSSKEAVYRNMMDDIAYAVNTADIDYATIVAYEQANGITARSAADVTLEEYEAEVQLLLDLTNTISSILNHAVSGDNAAFADSVAAHIVNEVKTQAAENGQDSLEYFDASSVRDAISTIDSEDIEADNASGLLEQLTDEEKFETDVATLETLREDIRETVKNALADEEKASETASTLANVVSDLVSAVSGATDEDGNLDASKLNFEKIASAVTSLQNSNLKDVGSSLLDIVASSDLGDNSVVSDMLGAVKEGYDNGEDIGGTINTAGALLGLGSAMSGEGENNQEVMVNSLTSLINNLNDLTISLLPSILSADTISSMGVPAEHVEATYNMIETLLKELMKQKGAENYDNEVNAILSLYGLATTGVDQFTSENITDLAGSARESEAVFNTLISVSVSNPFGIEIGEETVRAELISTIENEYAQSSKTEKELDIYRAIATLLGLDGEVNLG